jgi:hypothetical protein
VFLCIKIQAADCAPNLCIKYETVPVITYYDFSEYYYVLLLILYIVKRKWDVLYYYSFLHIITYY